jgi:hypothetical protein
MESANVAEEPDTEGFAQIQATICGALDAQVHFVVRAPALRNPLFAL